MRSPKNGGGSKKLGKKKEEKTAQRPPGAPLFSPRRAWPRPPAVGPASAPAANSPRGATPGVVKSLLRKVFIGKRGGAYVGGVGGCGGLGIFSTFMAYVVVGPLRIFSTLPHAWCLQGASPFSILRLLFLHFVLGSIWIWRIEPLLNPDHHRTIHTTNRREADK